MKIRFFYCKTGPWNESEPCILGLQVLRPGIYSGIGSIDISLCMFFFEIGISFIWNKPGGGGRLNKDYLS